MTDAIEQVILQESLPGLRAGQRLDEVLALLGPPDDRSLGRRPMVIRYGSLELAFDRGSQLVFAGVYFREGKLNLPQRIIDHAIWPSEPLTEQALLRQFADMGVPLNVEVRTEASLILRVGRLARFVLGRNDEGEPFSLESIQFHFVVDQPT